MKKRSACLNSRSDIMIKTGLPYMDKLLGGGLPENTVILISGGPGTGKTLFGLNFLLEGSKGGEKCCYVSLMENKSELLRACRGFSTLKKLEEYGDKSFVIQELKLNGEGSVKHDSFNLNQFVKLFNHYPKIERIVIDNVNKLLIYAKDKKEYRRCFSDLIRELKKRFTCSLILCETDGKLDSGNGEAFECDGIVHLSFIEMEEKPKRTLEIHKLRYSAFEPKIPHEFIIGKEGLKLSKTTLI